MRRWHPPLMAAALASVLLAPARAADQADSLAWDFDHQRQVAAVNNLLPGQVSHGHVSGQSTWDPYVSLRVPAEGIDAGRLTWLTIRLYSSEKADLLDIYYQSPDGHWCLGGKLPIAKGWATYRMDLSKNRWRETTTGDPSRQWGGPSRKVSSLRIDPGNQANRWVAIDSVRLEPPAAGMKEGVTVEPQGSARLTALRVPASISAGETLEAVAELEVTPAPGMTAATLFLRLRRGDTFLRLVEQPTTFGSGPVEVRARLPISPYWYPGPAVVEVGSYELDLGPQGSPAVAALEIHSDRVGKVKPPTAELRPLGGDAAIFVNGRPVAGFAYVGNLNQDCGYQREMGQAGIHLYADWVGATHNGDLGHVAPDRYDYAEYDRYFSAVLDADPEAWFIPHIGVTGALWWQEAHPEEMCQFADGRKGPTSFASEPWRRQIGEDLRRLIAYLRRAPYADRILGYMFHNGYTAEWQMWGTWQESRDDYSPPALRAFRAFLTRRYGSDDRLRAAWGDPQATLAAAEMPTWEKRRPGGPQVLRDPHAERQAIDFYEFIADMDADALLSIARVVREATEGQSLVGTYYAYLTAHGINQQDSGHLAARRVFDSPDIDFLMSPPNYWYRKPGEAATFMSATDSFRLRGKLWLDESDHRTHLSDPGAGYGRADNIDETLGVFWREFAETLTRRAAVTWYDMGGGWFSDPRILEAMGRANQIAQQSLPGRQPFAPEIGVFVDPESFYWMRPTMANSALDLNQVVTMPQSGAPWDFCLLDDIADPRLPDYKLYLFLNAFRVDADRRRAIQAKLARNGATALFLYASGCFDAQGPSPTGMEALTGIRILRDDREGRAQVVLEPGDPLAKGLAPQLPMGDKQLVVAPVFYADDPQARVVGRLLESKRPGLVVKK
ncbi:MAG: beta-galactosidase, partial [Thermoguttaceae bacterium]